MQKYILTILSFVFITHGSQASMYGQRELNRAIRTLRPLLGEDPSRRALHMICSGRTDCIQHDKALALVMNRFSSLTDEEALDTARTWVADPAFKDNPKVYAARKIAEAARLAEEQQEREPQAAAAAAKAADDVAAAQPSPFDAASATTAPRVLEQEQEAAAAKAADDVAAAQPSPFAAASATTAPGNQDGTGLGSGSGSPAAPVTKPSQPPAQPPAEYNKPSTPDLRPPRIGEHLTVFSTDGRVLRHAADGTPRVNADGTSTNSDSLPYGRLVAAAAAAAAANGTPYHRSSAAAGAQTSGARDDSVVTSKAPGPVDSEAALAQQTKSQSGSRDAVAIQDAREVLAAYRALRMPARVPPADFASGLSQVLGRLGAPDGEGDPTPPADYGLPTGPSGRIFPPLDDSDRQ